MRAIIRLILLLTVTGLTSCTKTTKRSEISLVTDTVKAVDTKVNVDTVIIEKFFPADKAVNIVDTIIQTLGIRITITEITLDTYVTNQHTDNNLKYVDKYRDIERTLKILKDNTVLVDTIFRKETFNLNKEFAAISNFYSYTTNKVESDKIEFFGLIGKPETDWTFAFYHYFDVKTKKFEIKELEEEEN